MASAIKNAIQAFITGGDFVTVTDNGLAELNVKEGDLCYVAGYVDLPASEDDPYTLKRAFILARTVDGHVLPDGEGFMCSPHRIVKVSEEEQRRLEAIFEEDFSCEE